MKITQCTEYKEQGCNFVGNLVVFDYTEELKGHPNYGKFNAGSVWDALDLAKKEALQRYPEHEIVLGLPVLVIRLK